MIDTAFTRAFGLKYPVAIGPMPGVACGHLAAAVAEAGGLGLIAGGDLDADALASEFAKTGQTAVGCNLKCDALDHDPSLLEAAVRHRPRAVYLSEGDPRPHAATLQQAKVRVMCEVVTLEDAKRAVEAEADVMVARGAGAAGKDAPRAMFNLIPELADYIHHAADDMILLAYGGIVDARTLAAVIALGADGACMGTRLMLSSDCRLPPSAVERALKATGDDASTDVSVSQGVGVIKDAPSVENILATLNRRAERILSHSVRSVIR